mgnify:CR=1 FL=1
MGSKKALFMRVKINYYTLVVEAAKVRYYQGLSEKQQRHFWGIEYIMLGRGSKLYLSKLYQCSRNRITLGYKEILLLQATEKIADYTRQRKIGGGAKKKSLK